MLRSKRSVPNQIIPHTPICQVGVTDEDAITPFTFDKFANVEGVYAVPTIFNKVNQYFTTTSEYAEPALYYHREAMLNMIFKERMLFYIKQSINYAFFQAVHQTIPNSVKNSDRCAFLPLWIIEKFIDEVVYKDFESLTVIEYFLPGVKYSHNQCVMDTVVALSVRLYSIIDADLFNHNIGIDAQKLPDFTTDPLYQQFLLAVCNNFISELVDSIVKLRDIELPQVYYIRD